MKESALGNSASKRGWRIKKPIMCKHTMGWARFGQEEFSEFNLEEQNQSSQIQLILQKCQHLFFALVLNFW